MKTEIQKLRAELERERNAADLVARDSDTYRRERDTLRAEVERLTKERDEALQKAVERDEDQQDAIIEQEKEIAELNSELATLRATREQDHGAVVTRLVDTSLLNNPARLRERSDAIEAWSNGKPVDKFIDGKWIEIEDQTAFFFDRRYRARP